MILSYETFRIFTVIICQKESGDLLDRNSFWSSSKKGIFPPGAITLIFTIRLSNSSTHIFSYLYVKKKFYILLCISSYNPFSFYIVPNLPDIFFPFFFVLHFILFPIFFYKCKIFLKTCFKYSLHLGVQSGPCEEQLVKLDEQCSEKTYKVDEP